VKSRNGSGNDDRQGGGGSNPKNLTKRTRKELWVWGTLTRGWGKVVINKWETENLVGPGEESRGPTKRRKAKG